MTILRYILDIPKFEYKVYDSSHEDIVNFIHDMSVITRSKIDYHPHESVWGPEPLTKLGHYYYITDGPFDAERYMSGYYVVCRQDRPDLVVSLHSSNLDLYLQYRIQDKRWYDEDLSKYRYSSFADTKGVAYFIYRPNVCKNDRDTLIHKANTRVSKQTSLKEQYSKQQGANT